MIALRLEATARGISAKFLGTLVAAVLVAFLAASLAFQMKTPADRLVAGPTLDSTVLLGLVLPATVLARTLNNSVAWLAATSPRRIMVARGVWIMSLFAGAVVTGLMIALPLRDAQHPSVVFWAALVLFDLAVISAVLFSANLAWLLPGATALVCSVPGLLPIKYNYLVRADRVQDLTTFAVSLGVVAAAAYIAVDEYGLRRTARLVERQDGVLNE